MTDLRALSSSVRLDSGLPPSQAFLKSIKPYLNPISQQQAAAEDNPLKTIDWHDEALEIDWTGIFWLTLKAQVSPS